MGSQGGQGAHLQGPWGSRSRPAASHGVKGWAYWVAGDQGMGLQGPRESRGRPIGSQGGPGGGVRCSIGSIVTFDGSQKVKT